MLDKLMTNHRTIRRYTDEPIAEADLALILEAGRLAPTARNDQDIKLLVSTDRGFIQGLQDACRGQAMVETATGFLGVATGTDRLMGCQEKAGTVDASIVLTCMALQAEALGYGLCWLGNFDHEKMAQAFDLSADYKVVAVAPMGRPAEFPQARPRKAIEDLLVRK